MNAKELATHKEKLLDAALLLIRSKGFTATSVEDICAEAGVTKGSFFHYFKSKEALAVAAAEHFGRMADSIFETAPYRKIPDPLERVLGYIDFRIAILGGELPHFTCLLGTMVQEVFDSHPPIREACDRYISAHAAEVEKDITAAKSLYAPEAIWSPKSLAFHTQAVIQGAFILAKAKHSPTVAADSLRHLRKYIELLFTDAVTQSRSGLEKRGFTIGETI